MARVEWLAVLQVGVSVGAKDVDWVFLFLVLLVLAAPVVMCHLRSAVLRTIKGRLQSGNKNNN